MQPPHNVVAEPFIWSGKAWSPATVPQSEEGAWLPAQRDSCLPCCQRPDFSHGCCIPSRDLTCLLLFQLLANSKAHTSRFISANLPCNKFKNRLVNIMPYELTRVCLQPIRGVEGSDYINASFIDGYR